MFTDATEEVIALSPIQTLAPLREYILGKLEDAKVRLKTSEEKLTIAEANGSQIDTSFWWSERYNMRKIIEALEQEIAFVEKKMGINKE